MRLVVMKNCSLYIPGHHMNYRLSRIKNVRKREIKMLKFILCFLIGLFVGCMIGVFIMCLVRFAGQADSECAEKDETV